MRRFNNMFQVDGYLAAPPTSRTLPSGTLVANAHLAEPAQYTNAAENREQKPNWFPLSFYDAPARKALKCDKGEHLVITKARIEQREFTTAKDGRKRTIWEVIVDDFHIIERKTGEPVGAPTAGAAVAAPVADAWPVGD